MVWHFLVQLECQTLATRYPDGLQRQQVLLSLEHISRQQMQHSMQSGHRLCNQSLLLQEQLMEQLHLVQVSRLHQQHLHLVQVIRCRTLTHQQSPSLRRYMHLLDGAPQMGRFIQLVRPIPWRLEEQPLLRNGFNNLLSSMYSTVERQLPEIFQLIPNV
jgi:hypothetical protein